MNPFFERDIQLTRRQFFSQSASGIGGVALASILGNSNLKGAINDKPTNVPAGDLPHHIAKAKRVIYLMQGGGPSHVDLLDPKPFLADRRGMQLPDSVRMGQRLTTMTSDQAELPVLPAIKPFRRYGENGMELSEMIPYTGEISDDICVINSMHTEAINHAPACTFFLTGSQIPGRPSMGAWVSYGLGSENENLPTFVVMTSRDRENSCGQLFFDYYWGSGFIPSKFQGVRFRGEGDPVLYLSNPKGIPRHDCSRIWRHLTEKSSRTMATRKSPPASPNTRWPSVCRPRYQT